MNIPRFAMFRFGMNKLSSPRCFLPCVKYENFLSSLSIVLRDVCINYSSHPVKKSDIWWVQQFHLSPIYFSHFIELGGYLGRWVGVADINSCCLFVLLHIWKVLNWSLYTYQRIKIQLRESDPVGDAVIISVLLSLFFIILFINQSILSGMQ